MCFRDLRPGSNLVNMSWFMKIFFTVEAIQPEWMWLICPYMDPHLHIPRPLSSFGQFLQFSHCVPNSPLKPVRLQDACSTSYSNGSIGKCCLSPWTSYVRLRNCARLWFYGWEGRFISAWAFSLQSALSSLSVLKKLDTGLWNTPPLASLALSQSLHDIL